MKINIKKITLCSWLGHTPPPPWAHNSHSTAYSYCCWTCGDRVWEVPRVGR